MFRKVNMRTVHYNVDIIYIVMIIYAFYIIQNCDFEILGNWEFDSVL